MRNKRSYIVILAGITLLLSSCVSTNITNYYNRNQQALDSIERSYKRQYQQNPFSLLFTDKSFSNVAIEIVTDSIKFIYDFEISEARIKDSLLKYNLDPAGISSLIASMRLIRCAWIHNLNFYEDGKKNDLVYMSIRSQAFTLPFQPKKYYILSYFAQPQYYDAEGRLLAQRRRKILRKINNDVFKRINNRVCYTISTTFR